MDLEALKQLGITIDRELTDEDIQMITKYGVPLNDTQLQQLQSGIPIERIEKDISQTMATQQRGLDRAKSGQGYVGAGAKAEAQADVDLVQARIDAAEYLKKNIGQTQAGAKLGDVKTVSATGTPKATTASSGGQTILGQKVQTGDNGLKYVEVNGKKYAADENNETLKKALGTSSTATSSTNQATGTSDSIFGLPIQTGDDGMSYVEFGGQKYAAAESNKALKSAMEAKGVSPSGTSGSSNVGYEEALAQLEANPQFQALPESLKSLFRQTLNEFDYSQDVNIENIMKSFNDIKDNTIDPRFSKEVEAFTNQVQGEYETLQQERDIALESERANAGQSIRQAKAGLEQSGMTFTGKGIEELGEQSAFAQDGSQIPSQQQTQGMFYEGNVNQANRLMSSSSALRYQKALSSLGQQAEDVLGGSSSLIPGYTSTGDLPGSAEDQKQTMYAQTLANISAQQRAANAYNAPVDYTF